MENSRVLFFALVLIISGFTINLAADFDERLPANAEISSVEIVDSNIVVKYIDPAGGTSELSRKYRIDRSSKEEIVAALEEVP